MILQSKEPTDLGDLQRSLERQFSNYSVYAFNGVPRSSLIVRKSHTVGAQVSIDENEIRIDACCPKIMVSGLIGFISCILPPYHRFEIKIADFLRKKYS
ncbi:hypothetical protein [Cyclobacterium jeungdonense]|uniref:Uncharacterized protein n=1 Tax=Cyclobacterium jeungdonense TaxID=708087 RepID=A0ABT8CB81_9BACT|nr:hypothetical protein [Cyclobacterium jeungdonense]MDN3689352.1 hypothetical protein [Cyclobacterium jeungdonense]